MTKTMLLVAGLLLAGISTPVLAEEQAGACGDPRRIAALYHEAVFSGDRAEAERRLVAALFPVISCLSRDGYLESPSGLPGRFRLVIEVLAAMRRESIHVSTPDDVQRQVRIWKIASQVQEDAGGSQ